MKAKMLLALLCMTFGTIAYADFGSMNDDGADNASINGTEPMTLSDASGSTNGNGSLDSMSGNQNNSSQNSNSSSSDDNSSTADTATGDDDY